MKTSNMPVIELFGSPLERGRIYGEVARELINEIVESWREDLGKFGQNSTTTKSLNADEYLTQFLSQTQYLNSIEQWAPQLLEEVKGIAEASGQTFDNIMGLQLMDEEWIFGCLRRLVRPATKCTAFGAPSQAGGVSYAGQNMDIGSWVDGKQVLLRIMPNVMPDGRETPEALVFSMAGALGLNGFNAAGLGLTCNTLPQLTHSVEGLPVMFIVRSILGCSTIDQAEQFLRTIKHASGQNYILSSQGDMRCFECCGSSIVRYVPEEFEGRIFHTNGPLVSTDFYDVPEWSITQTASSEARYASICNRLGNVSQSLTLDDAKAALSAHDDRDNPVSRNTNYEGSSVGFTVGSSIYEIGPTLLYHFASGPPCETDFKVFEFKTRF